MHDKIPQFLNISEIQCCQFKARLNSIQQQKTALVTEEGNELYLEQIKLQNQKVCPIFHEDFFPSFGLPIRHYMTYFLNKSSDEAFQFNAKVYPEIMDFRVLKVLEDTSNDDDGSFSFSSINWQLLKSPLPFRSRDLSTIERIEASKDNNGNEIGVYITESIDIKEIPSYRNILGCNRANIHLAFIFYYQGIDKDIIRVQLSGYLDPGGNIPAFSVNSCLGCWPLKLNRLISLLSPIDNEHIKEITLMKTKHLVCQSCKKSIRKLTRKNVCDFCGCEYCEICLYKRQVIPKMMEKENAVAHIMTRAEYYYSCFQCLEGFHLNALSTIEKC